MFQTGARVIRYDITLHKLRAGQFAERKDAILSDIQSKLKKSLSDGNSLPVTVHNISQEMNAAKSLVYHVYRECPDSRILVRKRNSLVRKTFVSIGSKD